jgi:hypothetical protein
MGESYGQVFQNQQQYPPLNPIAIPYLPVQSMIRGIEITRNTFIRTAGINNKTGRFFDNRLFLKSN